MVWKMWLARFQLLFLCFTSVNSRQVGRRFEEAGEIIVSDSQRKIGNVVDLDGFRELGFLGRKTMANAFSREDEQDEGSMKNSRRRISDIGPKNEEENKDSEKFNARFEDHVSNGVEHTRLKSKRSLRSNEKPIVDARKKRRNEAEDGEDEEEKLMQEAEKVAKMMHNDYREISHSRPPANN